VLLIFFAYIEKGGSLCGEKGTHNPPDFSNPLAFIARGIGGWGKNTGVGVSEQVLLFMRIYTYAFVTIQNLCCY